MDVMTVVESAPAVGAGIIALYLLWGVARQRLPLAWCKHPATRIAEEVDGAVTVFCDLCDAVVSEAPAPAETFGRQLKAEFLDTYKRRTGMDAMLMDAFMNPPHPKRWTAETVTMSPPGAFGARCRNPAPEVGDFTQMATGITEWETPRIPTEAGDKLTIFNAGDVYEAEDGQPLYWGVSVKREAKTSGTVKLTTGSPRPTEAEIAASLKVAADRMAELGRFIESPEERPIS